MGHCHSLGRRASWWQGWNLTPGLRDPGLRSHLPDEMLKACLPVTGTPGTIYFMIRFIRRAESHLVWFHLSGSRFLIVPEQTLNT